MALRQRAGLATIYSYGLAGVNAPETTDFSRERLLAVLTGGGAGELPPDPDDPYVRAIRGGQVTAPLVGGCLRLLMLTMGTPWELQLDGCLLFSEDVDERPWYVDSYLTQLGHAGNSRASQAS